MQQGEVPAPITSPGANVEQKALHQKVGWQNLPELLLDTVILH